MDLARELKKLLNIRVTIITVVVGELRTIPRGLDKKLPYKTTPSFSWLKRLQLTEVKLFGKRNNTQKDKKTKRRNAKKKKKKKKKVRNWGNIHKTEVCVQNAHVERKK